jgi:hypothetical protein
MRSVAPPNKPPIECPACGLARCEQGVPTFATYDCGLAWRIGDGGAEWFHPCREAFGVAVFRAERIAQLEAELRQALEHIEVLRQTEGRTCGSR